MNEASRCYAIYWGDTLVGFRTYLSFPSGVLKYAWRGSRLVILPDFQNLGFGTAILEFLGELYLAKGLKYFDRSSHLRLKAHWSDSPKWVETSSSGKTPAVLGIKSKIKFGQKDAKLGRIAYSFEYMGNDYANKPHLHIYVDDNANIDYECLKNDLAQLKPKYWICVHTGEIHTESEIEKICLSLGIRTELLYHTVNKQITKKSDCVNHKTIIIWNQELSQYIKNNETNFVKEIIPEKFIADENDVGKNVNETKQQYLIKKQELW